MKSVLLVLGLLSMTSLALGEELTAIFSCKDKNEDTRKIYEVTDEEGEILGYRMDNPLDEGEDNGNFLLGYFEDNTWTSKFTVRESKKFIEFKLFEWSILPPVTPEGYVTPIVLVTETDKVTIDKQSGVALKSKTKVKNVFKTVYSRTWNFSDCKDLRAEGSKFINLP